MHFSAAYVENFGVLHRYSIQFDREVHVIFAQNGSGKSTFTAFLQAMLYGFQGTERRRDVNENIRKKYMPWQGGAFGGWLEVKTADQTIRITRFFGQQPKEDTLQLNDAQTGRVLPLPDTEPGEWLLGIDCDTFMRSVLFTPKATFAEAPQTLVAQLQSALNCSADANNDASAQKRLEQAIKELQPLRGNGGVIGELQQKQETIRQQWLAAEGKANQKMQLQQVWAELQNRQQLLRAAQEKAAEQQTEQARLEGRKTELQRQIRELTAALNGHVPTEQMFEEAERAIYVLESAAISSPHAAVSSEECDAAEQAVTVRESCDRQLAELTIPLDLRQRGKQLETYFQGVFLQKEEADALRRDAVVIQAAQNQLKKRNYAVLVCVLIGVVLCGLALLLPELPRPLIYLCAIFLLAAGCIGLFSGRKARKSQTEIMKKHTAVCTRYARNLPFGQALRQIVEKQNEWDHIYAQVMQLREERAELQRKRADAVSVLAEFFAKYGQPHSDEITAIAILRKKSQSLPDSESIVCAQSTLHAFWTPFGTEPLPEQRHALLAELKYHVAQLKRARAEWDALSRENPVEISLSATDSTAKQLAAEELRIRTDLEDVRAAERACVELQDQYARCTQQIQAAQHQRALLQKTAALLKCAQDQISTQYLQPMRERFLHYFRQAFSDSAKATLDADLRMFITEHGFDRPITHFSSGTRMAAALSTHLALADLLFRGECPFLILDDPFVHLDDAHMTQTVRLLRRISTHTQIIYFTCHSDRAKGLTSDGEL